MNVKIFSSEHSNQLELETALNEWLESDDIEVLFIKQSESMIRTTSWKNNNQSSRIVTVSVWYIDNTWEVNLREANRQLADLGKANLRGAKQ